MSMYSDACYELAARTLAGCERFGFAFNSYVTSRELGELAAAERARFDPAHPERFKGSQRAWDERVWEIAREAWRDAVNAAGKPGLAEEVRHDR